MLAVLATGALKTPGPAAAHETAAVDGYDILFGGADEPVITGERMWLEVRITDSETEDPVTDLEDDRSVAVQRPFGNDTFDFEVESRFGQPGVVRGGSRFHGTGDLHGLPLRLDPWDCVRDQLSEAGPQRLELGYPQPTPAPESRVTMDASMGVGIGVIVVGVIVAAVGMIGAFVLGRL